MKGKGSKIIIALALTLALFQSGVYNAIAGISLSHTPSLETVEIFSESLIEGDSFEECVECRVIVKATLKPDTYKHAESIIENNNLYIYQYSDAETAQKAVEYYNSLPYVKWAELDGVVESQALSYGNYMMQGDEAKEYISDLNLNKEEIIVAVLDTGAYFDSPSYNGRVIDSGYNFSDTGINNSAESDHPHGDYVSTIIVDNTSENVKIYAYKVLDELGYGTNSAVSLGIDMAVADGADIINMSLGSELFSNAVYDSIKNAHSKGVVIVCAAGNEGDDVSKHYPAAFDEVFTVGSIDRKGNYSFFSNYGEEIDFVAPGHNIEVNSYDKDYGTSFSAPFVSAAAAMVLSVNPELTIDETKDILIDASVPYKELSYHDDFHVIEDYEQDENNEPKEMFVNGFTDDESLYYGYGMPQIQNAIGITLGYEDAIKPEISVESGTFHEAFEVTISAPEGYEIYYTTNENYPSKDSAIKYSSPITIQSSQSIRAVAYSTNGMKSLHNTAEYRVLYYTTENDFTIDSDGYLTSYNGIFKEFIVPDRINGITVTGIRSKAFYDDDIISVVFPDTLTHVEKQGIKSYNAIYISAKGLLNVEKNSIFCPNVVVFDAQNLEYIGSITLGVRSINFIKLSQIGERAFSGFSHLKYANLPLITEIPWFAFSGCRVIREINCPLVTSVDTGAFKNCHWLKKINIPNVEKFISTYRLLNEKDSGTFERCVNLTEINLPNAITVENCKLFYECYNLKKVELPNTKTIGKDSFLYCTSLSEVYIPKAQHISDYAFAETYSLIELELPNVMELGNYVFKNSSLKTLSAPELETIGEYCFTYYNNMYDEHEENTSFNLLYAPNLKTTSNYAFAYTSVLTKLELPALIDLGKNAFLESSVSYFDAPKLQNTSSLPIAENSIAILSSKFSECSLDANGYSLTIYGTPDTYAQTYAEQYGLTFINAPAIINDLPAEYFEGNLTVDVAGFDKIYRWFGTNNENGTGVKLLTTSTTEKELDPSEYNYKYYFSIVISRDNGYNRSVKTSFCQNMLYSSTPSSDARITIAPPSERTIQYEESIVLYANATGLPEGSKIKWRIVNGSGVTLDPSVSGKTCTVTSKSNGNVTIEAYAVDKNGNSIVNKKGNRVYDREGITSEVSLWWIILYYIRQILSVTSTAMSSVL